MCSCKMMRLTINESESLREMKKERQQNHLTTGVVDQLLVVKPHCVSNARSNRMNVHEKLGLITY